MDVVSIYWGVSLKCEVSNLNYPMIHIHLKRKEKKRKNHVSYGRRAIQVSHRRRSPQLLINKPMIDITFMCITNHNVLGCWLLIYEVVYLTLQFHDLVPDLFTWIGNRNGIYSASSRYKWLLENNVSAS